MATIRDVAKLARVSPATVSRVLSGKGAVSEATRRRVLDAMAALNYEPNALGRNLRKQETKTVIVLIPDIKNPFFSEIIRGIEDVAIREGYTILLGNTDNDVKREAEYLRILNAKRADGLILTTARVEKDHILALARQKPVVLACEYLLDADVPSVSIDNVSSTRKATAHLLSLGHTRIAHLTGPLHVIISRDRLQGYQQALHQHGLSVDPALVQEGDWTLDSGYLLMRKLLALAHPPTAVFAANDEMAIGAIRAVRERGLRVPDDIAIVGFDDIAYAAYVDPPLTTVAQPCYEIGRTAMEMVLHLIRGEPIPQPQRVLEDRLVIRRSCGTPRRRNDKGSGARMPVEGPIHQSKGRGKA